MLRVEARPLDEAKLKVRWTLVSTVGAGSPWQSSSLIR